MARVLTWHNGEKSWKPFSDAEMTRRQSLLRAYIAEHDIDACLLTSYHNICYFSGFLYCYFGRRYGLVLDGDGATTISAAIDGGQPWRRSFGDNITYTDWRKDNFFYAVQQKTKGVKRLGIEFDHVNLDYKRLLEEALPGVEFVDVGQATMWMRTKKSDEEITLIKHGTRICDLGGWAAGRRSRRSARACRNTRWPRPPPTPWCARSATRSRSSS
jgi:creatinase